MYFLGFLTFLSLILISEPTRRYAISYAVFCLNKNTVTYQRLRYHDTSLNSLFLLPLDKKTSIPEGSHLVQEVNAKLPNPKLGHISASCWSVEYNNPFSLAILYDGKNMIGQKLFALSPLRNKSIPVEIISSHYVDPKGERVRS